MINKNSGYPLILRVRIPSHPSMWCKTVLSLLYLFEFQVLNNVPRTPLIPKPTYIQNRKLGITCLPTFSVTVALANLNTRTTFLPNIRVAATTAFYPFPGMLKTL